MTFNVLSKASLGLFTLPFSWMLVAATPRPPTKSRCARARPSWCWAPIRSALSPDTTSSVPDVAVACQIYDALVRFRKGFEIVPGLAKSSADFAGWSDLRFQLESAKWHDGQPVTSDDVKFTLLEVSSKYESAFRGRRAFYRPHRHAGAG